MGKKPSIAVVVPQTVKDILQDIATKQAEGTGKNVYPSDVVREAIQEYLENHGYDVEVIANRGGYRGHSDDKDA